MNNQATYFKLVAPQDNNACRRRKVSASPLEHEFFETMDDNEMPCVGGKLGGVVRVGDTNLVAGQKKQPVGILCYWVESFKDMQKQHQNLKKVLESKKRLKIDDGTKSAVGLTM